MHLHRFFPQKLSKKKNTHVSLVPLEHWRGAGGAGALLGLAPRPALGSENAPRALVLLFFPVWRELFI